MKVKKNNLLTILVFKVINLSIFSKRVNSSYIKKAPFEKGAFAVLENGCIT